MRLLGFHIVAGRVYDRVPVRHVAVVDWRYAMVILSTLRTSENGLKRITDCLADFVLGSCRGDCMCCITCSVDAKWAGILSGNRRRTLSGAISPSSVFMLLDSPEASCKAMTILLIHKPCCRTRFRPALRPNASSRQFARRIDFTIVS